MKVLSFTKQNKIKNKKNKPKKETKRNQPSISSTLRLEINVT